MRLGTALTGARLNVATGAATSATAPSRRALATIERDRATHLGHVSEAAGFLPIEPLAGALPGPHRAWDELAGRLPALWSELAVRRAVPDLPLLPAGPDDLPDAALWRASVVLAAIAYSYARCDLHHLHQRAPLPENVARPWAEVAGRMGRRAPHVAYDDLITANWRLIDPDRPDPIRSVLRTSSSPCRCSAMGQSSSS